MRFREIRRVAPSRRGVLNFGVVAIIQNACPSAIQVARAQTALPLAPSRPPAQVNRTPSYLEFGPGGAGQGNADADTACLRAAFAAGGKFTIPAGQPVFLNGGVTASRWIEVDGAGSASPLILTSDFPRDADVITLKPQIGSAGDKFVGWRIASLAIKSQTNGRGRHGIVIDHSLHPYTSNAELVIERVAIGDVIGSPMGDITVGGYALYYVPHPTDPDGLYCSTIRNNYFVGGVRMTRAGDSLTFSGNWVKGRNVAFDIEFVRGAANATFENNNCTAAGSFRLKNGFRCRIVGNQCEMISQWGTEARGPEALIALEDCNGTTIEGNNLSADILDHTRTRTADCIHLLGTTSRTLVRGDNRLVCNPEQGRVHLRVATSTSLTTVEPGALTQTALTGSAPWITAIDSPGAVRGLWSPLFPLAGWTAASASRGLRFRIAADGTVSLDGQVSAGAGIAGPVAMLPIGARPARLMRVSAFAQRGTRWEAITVLIHPDGSLRLDAPTGTPTLLSFESTQFVAEAN